MKGYQVENIPREYENFHFTPSDFMGFYDLNSTLLIVYKTRMEWIVQEAKSLIFFIFQ